MSNNPFAQNLAPSNGRFRGLLSSGGGKQMLSTSKEAAKRNLDVSPSQMAKANMKATAIVSQFGLTGPMNKTAYVMESSASKNYNNNPALGMSGRRSTEPSPMRVDTMHQRDNSMVSMTQSGMATFGVGTVSQRMRDLNNSQLNASMGTDTETDELCLVHPGEPIIAVDDTDPTLYGCNKCVFEKRLDRPRFLVTSAKRTKKRIDTQYQELVKNLDEIEKLEPDAFQQRVQNEVSTYFNTVYRKIKEIEKEVISQIKASKNLELLKGSLDALLQKLNHTEMAKLQEEKKTLDARVDAQRYAYIARREPNYQQVEQNFTRINTWLGEKIAGVKQYENDLYSIDGNYESQLFTDIFSVVQKSFKIDKETIKSKDQAVNHIPSQGVTHQVKVFSKKEKPAEGAQQASIPTVSNPEEESKVPASAQKVSAFNPTKLGTQTIPVEETKMAQKSSKAKSISDRGSDFVSQKSTPASTKQKKSQQMIESSILSFENKPEAQAMMRQVSLNDTLLVDPQPAAATTSEKSQSKTPSALQSPKPPQQTDFFFGPENSQNKHRIVRRYIRNDFAPVVVAELDKTFSPKIVYTTQVRGQNPLAQRVFVLGGSNSKTKQISDDVFEVNLQQSATPRSSSNLNARAKMPVLKHSFGCCIDSSGQAIYAIGGQDVSRKATAKCEKYSIATDTWSTLPELKVPVYSASCILTQKNWILTMGGFDQADQLTGTIQKLALSDPEPTWQTLKITLPKPCCSMGLIQLADGQVIIFGGWKNGAVTPDVVNLVEKANGNFSIKQFKDKSGNLQAADSFLVNDVSVENGGSSKEFLVPGQECVHSFNAETHKFKTVRQINSSDSAAR